jgi:hypothetical protein
MRYEFVEMIIRITIKKYIETYTITNYETALQRIFDEGFLSAMQNVENFNLWRK